jgi:hypothetical protein
MYCAITVIKTKNFLKPFKTGKTWKNNEFNYKSIFLSTVPEKVHQ